MNLPVPNRPLPHNSTCKLPKFAGLWNCHKLGMSTYLCRFIFYIRVSLFLILKSIFSLYARSCNILFAVFDIIITVMTKSEAFWNVVVCHLVNSYRYFGGA